VSSTAPQPPDLATLADDLAAGRRTSVELVERALARIEETQPTLNAFRLVRGDEARAEAAEADRRLAAGERLPLLGIPTAIKDDMDLAGHPTSHGCDGTFEPREEDGECARRLRDAGAVIVGKTNMPEFGLYPFTEGRAFGATRNPWNLDHTPGGSSGGSAAAVAAGIIPAAMGSDGAGSVRIPAGWTGLVGIKPERGRISTWPAPEAYNGIAVIGPLARTVADAALMLDVASGNRDGDLHCPPAHRESFLDASKQDPGRLRIALSFRAPFVGTPVRPDPEIRAAIKRLASVLEGLGHEVVRRDPSYGLVGPVFVTRSLAGVHDEVQRHPDRDALDPRSRSSASLGKLISGRPYRYSRRAEARTAKRVGRIFEDVDVVLTPATAALPFEIGAADGRKGLATDRMIAGACPYGWVWNHLGWPGVSVPAGLSSEGLPMGAQLLGHYCDEPKLLALAQQLEDAERWYERYPATAAG
jgi:amidase